MDVIITTEDNTIVIDNDTSNTVVTDTDVTYTIVSPAEQGPSGTVTLDYITSELLSADTGNNLKIGTDGKIVSSPVLSSTNW